MIKPFGNFQALPGSAGQPDLTLGYQVVFDISQIPTAPEIINPGLLRVARLYNLLEAGGIPASQVHLVVVLRGQAIHAALNHAGYHARYILENPNLEVIDALCNAGIEVYVCGQTLIDQKYRESDIYTKVSVALSALTLTANLQLQGYALMVG